MSGAVGGHSEPGAHDDPAARPGSCSSPLQPVQICNKPGRGSTDWWDRTVACDEVATHTGHGCLTGTCASNGK